jgi:ABC-2 type transport system permease protein
MTVALHSTRSRSVIGAVVKRALVRVNRVPATFIPSVAMPVFQLIAFGGAFAGALTFAHIRHAYDWFVPMTAIQGAAFGAMGVTFGAINDLQTGFFDRLRMSPGGRRALTIGPLAAALARAVLPVLLVTAVGFIGGAHLPGGLLGLITMFIAAFGIAFVAAGLGLGLAYRMRSLAAATVTQFFIFFTIFLSTAQMPLQFIQGWVRPIARINPITNVLRLARAGFLGDVTWDDCWGGLLALLVMGALSTVFAVRSLRTFDR